MSETTKIEWTDATFNPWIGCTKVSPACDHCYAEASTPARTLGVIWGAKEDRHRTSAGNWKLPRRWNAQHDEFFAAHGRRRRVFCASLADVFDNAVDPAWRADLFQLIEQTPNLDWLLLTKRIGNVPSMMMEVASRLFWLDHLEAAHLPENVWLGATICNQEEADRDILKLLAVPARVRFLSMEPLLGPVDLRMWMRAAWRGPLPIGWVIVGGESGTNARPLHPDWARSLRDQCAAAGVPFLFKQWGEWAPVTYTYENESLSSWRADPAIIALNWREVHEFGDGVGAARVGKQAAGRLLDGVRHDGYPSTLGEGA